ncbi:3-hydroxybenzoate 4-monooxygenase [Galactobacter valiniphilus]|uniref:3-hydroxybenzoate 4-monooxygenase n=1 Tax=Galactobacter valiniphilus TaxID=2676122 RepID=A0A399J9W1_9MICC|nr:FAD-dependent monooxygenase [Galactobacter valiniphilus]RII41860.1 3-hydroxybenzoate 4-monooxygenase [Galactobacter valiniphilus]
MQFHHHGYVDHDPRLQAAAGVGIERSAELPEVMDVLIVGTGPAGMLLAAQLSAFPDIDARIIDSREERLRVGQADGVACRSVETFQAFGFAEDLIREAYHITETVFWGPDPANRGNIIRESRRPDDPRGLSEFPHLVCNQVRVQDKFAEVMANSPSRMGRDFGYEFVGQVREDGTEYPIVSTLRRTVGERAGEELTVRSKYLVGCDGARSNVRRSLGLKLRGDSANHAWGVMDVLVDTDFPDVRTKGVIQAHDGRSILLIPREGGHLVRFYVDLGEVPEGDNGSVRSTTVEQCVELANAILNPYTITVKQVAWSSVYEVGQRVADHFDDAVEGERAPRVFIAGDACHTHSAKAGQGMNVSMQDTFNLGWKLAHVLRGQAPESLLSTYSAERQRIAVDLITFDKQWSSLMAAGPLDPQHPERGGVDPEVIQEFYQRSFDFTMGFGTRYELAGLTGTDEFQSLATGYPLGERFRSAKAMRLADGNARELGHHHQADGRWRLYAFADAPAPGQASKLEDFAAWLSTDPASPVLRFTAEGADADSLFDAKVIYQQDYEHLSIMDAPEIFRPRIGPLQMMDYEKVYASLDGEDIFDARGVSREGAVVLVRPDMYVSAVLPLDRPELLAAHLDAVLQEPAVAAF